jgi:hypothetical protein
VTPVFELHRRPVYDAAIRIERPDGAPLDMSHEREAA